jgi:hypothetical protein
VRSVVAGATLLVALTASPAAAAAEPAPGALDQLGRLPGHVVPDAPAEVVHRRTLARRRARLEDLRRDVRAARRTAHRRAERLDVRLAGLREERDIAQVAELVELRGRWRAHARALGRRLEARAERRRERARAATVVDELLCIHGHEGAWTSNTGNGYYGGLQMDLAFQRAYGPEYLAAYGTADRWPVAAQLTAGARAVASRGFTPWPAAAAACGLR